MRTGSILFMLGVLSLLQFTALPPLYSVWLLPLCLLLIWRGRWWRWPAWFVCGFLWALLRADFVITQKLATQLEGRPIVVEGRVVDLPAVQEKSVRFSFAIDKIVDRHGTHNRGPGKVRMSWYGDAPELLPGETWHLKVKLKRPYGFINPAGFDYEAWLFQQGIRATGYVIDKGGNVRLRASEGSYFQRLRFALRQKLMRLLPDRDAASLVLALAIGDRSTLSPQQWRVLKHTGTSHLLAISGLHIGFIAGLAFFISRWLWPLTGSYSLCLAAPRVAAIIAIICASVYAALAGFSVPTQRALIMLGMVLTLICLDRRTSSGHVVALALLLILVMDPFAVISPGFWLSFLAIVVIVYGMAFRVGNHGLWWRWGRVQWLVALGLAPMLAVWFQQVPLLGIAANSVAVPWVSLVSVPLILGGSTLLWLNESLGRLLLEWGSDSLDLIWRFLEIIAGVKAGVLPVPTPMLPVLLAAFIGVALLLMPRGLPGRYLGVIWLLPLIFPILELPKTGQFRLTLLDVGQGLAAVVQTRQHTLLYDTGPKYNDRFNAGSGVILPFLRHSGITRIDMLVQSHGDGDHIGGLDDVLDGVPVAKILTSIPERIRQPQADACQAGQSWQWDGVLFEIVHPAAHSRLRGNNRSCVLRISQENRAVLLTGDIERPAEQQLVRRYAEQLHANVLVAPHHGSRTSSSVSFIETVNPDYVLFPVGYHNRYGFPKKDIIGRYRERRIKTLDTARSGAIEVRINSNGLTIVKCREQLQRFWHTLY
ncbi:MAG: DNA internalization-related competence protein ComEC/Rec2 [Gammaproteobacteria bacterium]